MEDNGYLTSDVDAPAHYTRGGVQVIDIIETLGIGFHTGNILKYVLRSKFKGAESKDLQKANWYLRRIIEKLRSGDIERSHRLTHNETENLLTAYALSGQTSDVVRELVQLPRKSRQETLEKLLLIAPVLERLSARRDASASRDEVPEQRRVPVGWRVEITKGNEPKRYATGLITDEKELGTERRFWIRAGYSVSNIRVYRVSRLHAVKQKSESTKGNKPVPRK